MNATSFLSSASSSLFSDHRLQHLLVQAQICHQLLQTPVLVFHLPKPLRFTYIHAAELCLPVVKCRLADPVFAAQLGCLHPRLVLLQNPDDLLFAVSAILHAPVLPFNLRENSSSHWLRFSRAGQHLAQAHRVGEEDTKIQ
jgi:hypothetical protein